MDYYCREFGVDPRKVAVVPVGFDDRVFSRDIMELRPGGEPAGQSFTVLFFGSFLPLHGVDDVIEAARLVEAADRSVSFRFIGSGQTLGFAQANAAELGLANVAFEGWQSQSNLAARDARSADIFLGIYGRTEKADRVVPHKVFQAMALGKPVITARTSAVEEFFADRENILLCRKGDAASLAEAILELRWDTALRQRIALSGRETVWRQYNPAALGAVLRGILEKARAGGSGA
jgi:glycosyltransferase involved in cell wall biosynthesis